MSDHVRAVGLNPLQRLEWMNALQIAMLCMQQAESDGDPIPDRLLGAIWTWDGAIANVISILHTLHHSKPQGEIDAEDDDLPAAAGFGR